MAKLIWTGERLVPEVMGEIAIEHLARYAFCHQFISGKKVLDVACGEGYGTYQMANVASEVIGIDNDQATIDHAATKYKRSNIQYLNASITQIPLPDYSYDVIVCLETLEHIEEHDQALKELKRLLKPEGILIISTPNTETYSDRREYNNPFHKKELNQQQFLNLLTSYFSFVEIFGQQNILGSIIVPLYNEKVSLSVMEGNFNESKNLAPDPMYFIVMASDASLIAPGTLIYSGAKVIDTQTVELDSLKASFSFRIGRMITWPFRTIKQVFE